MLGGGPPAGPALRPEHHGYRQLAAGHEVGLRRLIDELVEGEREEVDEHDLHHRPQAGLGGADGDPAHGALADGGVEHALAAEAISQALGGQIRTSLGHILADHDAPLVGRHRLRQRAVDRLDVGGLGHDAYTRAAACAGVSGSPDCPNSTARSTSASASAVSACAWRSSIQARSAATDSSWATGSSAAHSASVSALRLASGSPS